MAKKTSLLRLTNEQKQLLLDSNSHYIMNKALAKSDYSVDKDFSGFFDITFMRKSGFSDTGYVGLCKKPLKDDNMYMLFADYVPVDLYINNTKNIQYIFCPWNFWNIVSVEFVSILLSKEEFREFLNTDYTNVIYPDDVEYIKSREIVTSIYTKHFNKVIDKLTASYNSQLNRDTSIISTKKFSDTLDVKEDNLTKLLSNYDETFDSVLLGYPTTDKHNLCRIEIRSPYGKTEGKRLSIRDFFDSRDILIFSVSLYGVEILDLKDTLDYGILPLPSGRLIFWSFLNKYAYEGKTHI